MTVVTDPETGHTITRYYDGLIPTDKPGQYVGIEHKVNQGVGGAIAAADIGLNADIIVAAGSTVTRRSGVMLDTSTKNTTATLGLLLSLIVIFMPVSFQSQDGLSRDRPMNDSKQKVRYSSHLPRHLHGGGDIFYIEDADLEIGLRELAKKSK